MQAKRIAAALATLACATAWGADDAAQRKDLTAVIALHALPCGEVVSYEVKGEKDFVATCKDGNKYHVYVNDAGRVVVEKSR